MSAWEWAKVAPGWAALGWLVGEFLVNLWLSRRRS